MNPHQYNPAPIHSYPDDLGKQLSDVITSSEQATQKATQSKQGNGLSEFSNIAMKLGE